MDLPSQQQQQNANIKRGEVRIWVPLMKKGQETIEYDLSSWYDGDCSDARLRN
jgi:hypothetical protein